MEKRRLLVVIMLAFAFSLFLVSAKTVPINNESSCKAALGEWQYISPENAESRFECVCEEFSNGKQVKIWDGTSCEVFTDEMKCIKTQGVWNEDKCECSNGKWVNGVGCQFIEHNTNLSTIFIISLVVLIIILIILILYLKSRRK